MIHIDKARQICDNAFMSNPNIEPVTLPIRPREFPVASIVTGLFTAGVMSIGAWLSVQSVEDASKTPCSSSIYPSQTTVCEGRTVEELGRDALVKGVAGAVLVLGGAVVGGAATTAFLPSMGPTLARLSQASESQT